MDDLVTSLESAGNADRVAIGKDLLTKLRDTGHLEGGEAGRLLSVCIGFDMILYACFVFWAMSPNFKIMRCSSSGAQRLAQI